MQGWPDDAVPGAAARRGCAARAHGGRGAKGGPGGPSRADTKAPPGSRGFRSSGGGASGPRRPMQGIAISNNNNTGSCDKD